MIYLHRLLLLNSAEKQPPLRGRSNASWLPHLLWGNIIQISYFISTEYYQFVELLKLTLHQIWWLQYLFESVNDVTVLLCGHTIHKSCLKEMREHFQWVSRSSSCLLTCPFLSAQSPVAVNVVIFVFDSASGMHALSAWSRFVICQRFGRNLTWRLLLHQCLNRIKTKWSVSFVCFSFLYNDVGYCRSSSWC